MNTLRPQTQPVAKKLRLRPQAVEIAREISAQFSLGAVASRVLAARGFKADNRTRLFISPSLREGLPLPAQCKNLPEACDLIVAVVNAGERIALCCDFDVDGLSGAAQVYAFLNSVNADVKVFIPDRFTDGYGLNSGMVRNMRESGCSLLVAIDFGTKNNVELSFARELGMKTVVIDHHHVGDAVVTADVFVNPHQEGCGFADKLLCASALAWYLVAALRSRFEATSSLDPKLYLDLACLGTICDMVPLIGPNRVIAKKGLELLSKTERVGLRALKNILGLQGEVHCSDVSFGIGPRLNAAGRMVHGELVLKLLTTKCSDEANRLAHTLNKLNVERQEEEASVRENALEMLKSRGAIKDGIVVWAPDFHTGVIGIVAQRLVEIFHRPAVVMGMGEEGIYKGSVRGIRGFSVVEALASVSHCLLKFGGHEGAGGLAVEAGKIEEFAVAFEEECSRRLSLIDYAPYLDVDTEVSLGELSLSLVTELQQFAPFGVGNGSPILLARKLRVLDTQVLKGSHLKVLFGDFEGRRYHAFWWRTPSHPLVRTGQLLDIAFKAEKNSFQGNVSLQLTIQAVQAANET